ncbi:sensor histidine kinase [Paenibacillus caui]|uniref:sensor histidine kinase n=1 Tax=Paenibacillus caui TaxID=2873927 RepID=UPI001CA95BE7|nr:ATP-binding protein [Paenibacillus caui]
MKTKSALEYRTWLFARYGSLSLISLVYLVDRSNTSLITRLAVIALLVLSVNVAVRIYQHCRTSPFALRFAVIMEMIGVVLLLLPTGGMDSPFKWYALNPLMVASELLSSLFAWSLLVSYIGIIGIIFYIFFNFAPENFPAFAAENTGLIAALVVTVVAMQMIGRMIGELEKANARTDETLEHIKSIYHIVETASQHEFMNIGQVIADCVVKLTKLNKAFFWFAQRAGETVPASRQTGWMSTEESLLFAYLEEHLEEWRRNDEPFYRNLDDFGDFLLMPVRMNTRFVGMIGVRLESVERAEASRWLAQQLILLQELSSIILERHELVITENRLMIINEQNRIADEMHDSVSQSLFGIVYAAHSLKQVWRQLTEEQLEEQIDLIKESATMVAKDLRKTIHSLSSKKSGGQNWLGTVRTHLNTLSRLNDVEIDLRVSGDDYGLPYPYQKALFRVISEATGNAIRHGKARLVRVDMSLRPELVKLSVTDNGSGFEVERLPKKENENGLGMHNMRYLTKSLGGDISISSHVGAGTKIELSIPVGVLEYK